MRRILFVCTGNLCRSPMAAAILRRRLAEDPERTQWRVDSAGLWAEDGLPASRFAVTAMAERGYDLSEHRSQSVTPDLVAQADLILGMTPSHVEALRLAFPRHARKVHLLAEMVGGSFGVEDPYGESLSVYQAVADELEALIEEGYPRIVALAEAAASQGS